MGKSNKHRKRKRHFSDSELDSSDSESESRPSRRELYKKVKRLETLVRRHEKPSCSGSRVRSEKEENRYPGRRQTSDRNTRFSSREIKGGHSISPSFTPPPTASRSQDTTEAGSSPYSGSSLWDARSLAAPSPERRISEDGDVIIIDTTEALEENVLQLLSDDLQAIGTKQMDKYT